MVCDYRSSTMSLFDVLFLLVWIPLVLFLLLRRLHRGGGLMNLDSRASMSELVGDLKVSRAIRAVEREEHAAQGGALGLTNQPSTSGALAAPAEPGGGRS